MKFNKFTLLIGILLMGCSTMEYGRYKSTRLYKNSKKTKSENEVVCEYKVFTKKDCKKYLNTKNILKKGYQPIQITITNNSPHDITISPHDFSFSCVDAQTVAKLLHRNGAVNGAGFGSAAWFCPILVVPALVRGCGANQFNEDMDNDFMRKEFKDQVVESHKSVTGLIFVEIEDFTHDFTIVVHDTTNKSKITLTPKAVKKLYKS